MTDPGALLRTLEYCSAGCVRGREAHDPHFEIAWWGEAMSYNPIWGARTSRRRGALLGWRRPSCARGTGAPPRERATCSGGAPLREGSKQQRDDGLQRCTRRPCSQYPEDLNPHFRRVSEGLTGKHRTRSLHPRAAEAEPSTRFRRHPGRCIPDPRLRRPCHHRAAARGTL